MGFRHIKVKWEKTPYRRLIEKRLLQNRMLQRRVQRDARFFAFERLVWARYGRAVLSGGRWDKALWAVWSFVIYKMADRRRALYRSVGVSRTLQEKIDWGRKVAGLKVAIGGRSGFVNLLLRLRLRAAEVQANKLRTLYADQAQRQYLFGVRPQFGPRRSQKDRRGRR